MAIAHGTILVVDDNEAILRLVVKILKDAGYHVFAAENGSNAIRLATATEERIDLLLSDVDMPLMSGPELGAELKKSRPELKVMFMSGGVNGNLLVLNYGWAYIQKPFIGEKLLQMVSSVLLSPDRGQHGGDFEPPASRSLVRLLVAERAIGWHGAAERNSQQYAISG